MTFTAGQAEGGGGSILSNDSWKLKIETRECKYIVHSLLYDSPSLFLNRGVLLLTFVFTSPRSFCPALPPWVSGVWSFRFASSRDLLIV